MRLKIQLDRFHFAGNTPTHLQYAQLLLKMRTMTKDTLDQSPVCFGSSLKAFLSLLRVLFRENQMSLGKVQSSIRHRWKLSLIQSALVAPSLPSYMPKKDICLCRTLVLVRLVTMQILSSLQDRIGPGWLLAEYAFTNPYPFDDTLAFSMLTKPAGCVYYSLISLRMVLKAGVPSNCPLEYILSSLGSLFLRILKPDCDLEIYLSVCEVVFMDRLRWMFRESKSTFESDIIVLLAREELLRVGKFLSTIFLPPNIFMFPIYALQTFKVNKNNRSNVPIFNSQPADDQKRFCHEVYIC